MIIGGPPAECFRPFLEWHLGECDKKDTLIIANVTERYCGVVGLKQWGKNDIELFAAASKPGWVTRQFARHIAETVFVVNDCNHCTVKIRAKNKVAREAAVRAGFRHEGMMRQANDDGDDIHIYGMLREECKWLPRIHREDPNTTAQPSTKVAHKKCLTERKEEPG